MSGFPKIKNEIKLQYYAENVFHTLSEETANMVALEYLDSKTVSGGKWLTRYLELFPDDDKKQLTEK